jgi:aspartate/methionine/tyrosine aminotransferase
LKKILPYWFLIPAIPLTRAPVKLSGATPVYYSLKEVHNYYPDFEELEELIRISQKPVKGIFVNYPQMPTGQLPTMELFENLVAFAKRNDILVIP